MLANTKINVNRISVNDKLIISLHLCAVCVEIFLKSMWYGALKGVFLTHMLNLQS